MPRKRYRPEQIVAILREAERAGNNEETCRKHGVSNQTFAYLGSFPSATASIAIACPTS